MTVKKHKEGLHTSHFRPSKYKLVHTFVESIWSTFSNNQTEYTVRGPFGFPEKIIYFQQPTSTYIWLFMVLLGISGVKQCQIQAKTLWPLNRMLGPQS
jgi:hypothetical protein